MEAVDLLAKQMDEEREEPLSVHKVVQKPPPKSSKQPNKKSGKGRCYDVVKRGIMAETNAAHFANQSVQSVNWWVIMQLRVKPRQEVEQQTR